MTETTVQPNRERIQLWVDALRSDEFQQATGGLRNVECQMCATGVACEVARRNGFDGQWDAFGYFHVAGGEVYGGFIPYGVAAWFGFTSIWIYVSVDGKDVDITALNDGLRLAFAEIADALERTYLQPVPAC